MYLPGVTITPVDESTYQIFAPNQSAMDEAKEIIKSLVEDKVGQIPTITLSGSTLRVSICVYVTGEICSSDRTKLRIISYAVYISYFESNYLYHHMWHTFTIVELLLVALEFFFLLRTLRDN